MKRSAMHVAIGFSALAVGATIDAALGLGGVEWLADICFADENEMDNMPMPPTQVKPVPLIVLSLGITVSALGIIALEKRRFMSGRAAPNTAESAGILSAMVVVAAKLGKTSRGEIESIFKITTGHELEEPLVDLAFERYQILSDGRAHQTPVQALPTALGRRRALAAAMLMARKFHERGPEIETLFDTLIGQLGASVEDAAAVRASLDDWDVDCRDVREVPLVSLLRHRSLVLRPA